ncbi:MAG: NAD-dependent epimerase/dehydratase family protein, partial [Gemmatimonadaceae bacterium]
IYVPGDNCDLRSSHVLPAMIRKFHEARTSAEMGDTSEVTLWGTGGAEREFLHVDDLASAALRLLQSGATGLWNVGSGEALTVRELAALVADVVGYAGAVHWDTDKPDGTPRKLLDSSRIRTTGWEPTIGLRQGIADTYDWYLHSAVRIEAPALESAP